MAVTFDLDPGGLARLRANVVAPWARQRAEKVERCATADAPVDTGVLVNSIGITGPIDEDELTIWSVVATAPYAIFVEASQPFLGPCADQAVA